VLPEVTIQRILHLQLQGFTEQEAAEMQGVSVEEVYKIYNQDKVFSE
jgi:DNA-directed RNA polymerase specialized sigma24 family protein